MFEGRFSELLIIFVLALVVLGPEKLPRVVAELGRWMGRARAMARQFREQLEEEITLEEARRASASPATPQDSTAPAPGAGTYSSAAEARAAAAASGTSPENDGSAATANAQDSAGSMPAADAIAGAPTAEPARPVTWSHSHPTDSQGANPLRTDGAAEAAAQSPGTAPEPPAGEHPEARTSPDVPPADSTRPA